MHYQYVICNWLAIYTELYRFIRQMWTFAWMGQKSPVFCRGKSGKPNLLFLC